MDENNQQNNQQQNDGGTGVTPDLSQLILTKEQLDALIKDPTNPNGKVLASWKDGYVNSGIQTNRAKWEREKEEEKDEAKRLAKLSPQERRIAELEKIIEKEQLAKAEMSKQNLFAQAQNELLADGLDKDLAEFIMADTAEEVLERKDKVKSIINKIVEDKLKKELDSRIRKSNLPGSGTKATTLGSLGDIFKQNNLRKK